MPRRGRSADQPYAKPSRLVPHGRKKLPYDAKGVLLNGILLRWGGTGEKVEENWRKYKNIGLFSV